MISFGTKAETLENLSSVLKSGKVLPQYRFQVSEWHIDTKKILDYILLLEWGGRPLIVRSSAINEDNAEQSMAGRFTSVANVEDRQELAEAICTVIASYTDDSPDNQVFVQPMLRNAVISGVAFTKDPNTGSPYYVINYDDISGLTNTITSGQTIEIKTYYCFKYAPDSAISSKLIGVIALLQELEILLAHDELDIEFGTSEDQIYLFQVRPLIVKSPSINSVSDHILALKNIEAKIIVNDKKYPYLHGTKTVYGIMPDWNPAEIIGVRPRSLALSLYKEIVTDSIWAYQRDNYGYKNLRSFPLLINFHGLPYIDVRVSFNSFIPAEVDPELSERLVNFYIDRLIEYPNYHDKVEFEILYSCYTFDLPERMQKLSQYGFSDFEISSLRERLRILTNRIIHKENGLWLKDIDKIKLLEERRGILLKSDLDIVSKVYWLLEDCKRYGTLPFAGLARAGFIAVQLLRSLVAVGVLTLDEYHEFMGSLGSVSTNMKEDYQKLSKEAFLELYGHLRPGTYDILSARYDEEPNKYFDWEVRNAESTKEHRFSLSLSQLNLIQQYLSQHGLEPDALGLFNFIKGAIEGRENAKYLFTRSLSDAISLIKQLGSAYGFSPEECSNLNIKSIYDLYGSSYEISGVLQKSIEEGQQNYTFTKEIILPPLIKDSSEVWAFELPELEPNFITHKKISAKVSRIEIENCNLAGVILFIPSADPGFDWIFSKGIAGFITMYGGVNSHMAIRAGELGVPAVIGTGEVLFKKWAQAKLLKLDCLNRLVEIIR